jgi:hypothetical protein
VTFRKDVSVIENKWQDAQRVDQNDMEIEQNRNNEIDAAIIQNHFGSGVLISAPQQRVIFDSDVLDATQAGLLAAGNFDGTGLSTTLQPSDINLGNQLEVELSDSSVVGRLSVKVAIIGLSFDDTLQMDRFYFYRNEKQVTSKHYKRILTIFTNDFKGNNNCSRRLGGRLIIKEAESFQLSCDPIMISQDVEPDIFWRDFKVADLAISLAQTIQNGMGNEYSVDGLNINTTGLPARRLVANDVTSQVGQKFIAKTNNIQKITLLLGVEKNTAVPVENEFDWTGDLVISVYPLQTTVDCPTDIVPDLAIDFDPDYTPLAQISYNQTTLREYGYVLNDVPQPVDFVFSSTALGSVANGGVIVTGNFYAVTIKRSGAAISGTLFAAEGRDHLEDSRITLFSGVWVDVEEEDLWFQIWTDAAKVADGQGYDSGNGILFPKTITDTATGAVIDNQVGKYPLANTGENIVNTAVISALPEESVSVQDERTGNPVFSRKKFVPSFSFVTESDLNSLKTISEPLIIGCVQDTNPKNNPILEKIQTLPGLVKGDTFCIVNPDADLLSLNLLGSKLIPDLSSAGVAYKIFKVTSCVDGYGDVNGDGYIDSDDLILATTLVGESYHYSSTQQKIKDGYFSTLELLRADVDGDGYITSNDINLINQFVNKTINGFPAGSSFTHICLQVQQLIGRNDGYYDCDGYVRIDGYTGLDIVLPSALTAAELIYDGYMLTPTLDSNPIFNIIPFAAVNYSIVPLPFWQPYLLAINSQARQVPTTFTSASSIIANDCTIPATFKCVDKNRIEPRSDPGRNDFYVPDHLYIGRGEILRPDGSNYSVDFEIGTVILQLPQLPLNESAINIFDKFVADRGDGFTRAGYPAMRYADCTTVQSTDLAFGKVRFSVSLQSFAPNLDGYSEEDGYGVIVDDIIGVYLDTATGILKLTIQDLSVNQVYQTLVSKIQILVYLKKAGWKNTPLVINTSEVAGLISS